LAENKNKDTHKHENTDISIDEDKLALVRE